MRKFHHAKDGEWIRVTWPRWTIKCCRCSLVHKIDFRLFTDQRGKVVVLVKPTQCK